MFGFHSSECFFPVVYLRVEEVAAFSGVLLDERFAPSAIAAGAEEPDAWRWSVQSVSSLGGDCDTIPLYQ